VAQLGHLRARGPPATPLFSLTSVAEYFVAGQELRSHILPPTHKAKWHALDDAGEHTSAVVQPSIG